MFQEINCEFERTCSSYSPEVILLTIQEQKYLGCHIFYSPNEYFHLKRVQIFLQKKYIKIKKENQEKM